MAEATQTATKPAASVRAKARKKTVRQVGVGNMYVQATFNNTIVTATDLNGNALAWASSGHCGFKGPRKSTPYAATVILKTLADKLKDTGLKDVHVFVKGIGAGRDSAVRSINAQGFNVLSIKDLTPIPHNGCRPPRPRRL
jgi:small subunit ribosomal protein S11